MSDDCRDFIERSNSIASHLYGQPMSAERVADNFALYGLENRVATLENFDNELRGEIDGSPHTLRRRAELIALRRRMGSVHEALRNAGR
jgi:hypothetical protein